MVPCGTLILPYLYLGDESDASDPEKLKSHNIYYVLNVTADLPGDGEKGSIRYKRIPARDSFDQNLAQYFEESFQFIEEAKQAGRAVLIHCHAGISRSPTIVVAYLMYSQKMNFDNAFKFVVTKRPKISPNFSFVGQLYEYEKTHINLISPEPTTTPTPSSSPATTSTTTSTSTTTTTINLLPVNPLLTSSVLPQSPLTLTNTVSSSTSSSSTTLTCSTISMNTNKTIGTSTLPVLILPTSKSSSTPPPTLSLGSIDSTQVKILLSPISHVTNTLSTTTITTSISAPTTPTSPMPLPLPSPTMPPTSPISSPMPTTPTNRSYLKISDTLNKPFFLQPPPLNPSSSPLKDGLKSDVLPSSCEALSDIPYNSLGPVRGCRSRKSCNNDFILLRPIKMTKNTRVK